MRFTSLSFFLLISIFIHAQTKQLLFEGKPVFHGATVVGNRPNTDFLFTVPATGERPITFAAYNLPKGLTIDNNSGIITGNVLTVGEYQVKITARNAKGESEETLDILIGDKLCLTPPMGWNSWNVFTNTLDEKMVMEMADAMVSSGMRDLGYQYINMDDYWHAPSRDENGKPVADPQKFPHGIKYLSDYVHSKGLKLGIYSDAGDKTCGKCFGGFQHEEIDAQVYAEWGIDLLKYDFCFVPWKKKEALARYKKMGDALKNCNRTIVYSLCNWGLFKPWEWGQEVGGNYWRTTPDIFDTWKGGNPFMMSTMKILKRNRGLEKYAGPGHWNDPDMLIVGNYGNGKATSAKGIFKGMSDDEYDTHFALWCMMASPLLSSNDLRTMNETTSSILMNPKLLAINQDKLGEQASLISKKKGLWIFRKKLSDGSVAYSFTNMRAKEKAHTIEFVKLYGMPVSESRNLVAVTKAFASIVNNNDFTISLNPHETIVVLVSK